MTKIPTEFNGQINYMEVGFMSTYSKDEEYFVHKIKIDLTTLSAKYIFDYHSSIWILNDKVYQDFAINHEVISGGWYGYDSEHKWIGGRWNTLKRTYGDISFQGVKMLSSKKPNSNTNSSFKIKKSSFSNIIKIEISNNEIGEYKFECDTIIFNPSGKTALYSKQEKKFVDFTNRLEDNGLKLKE